MRYYKCIKYGSERVVRNFIYIFSFLEFPDVLALNDFNSPYERGVDSIYFMLCMSLTALRESYDDYEGENALGATGCYFRKQLYILRDIVRSQCGLIYERGYFCPSVYRRISYYLDSLDDAIAIRVVEAKAQSRTAAENES